MHTASLKRFRTRSEAGRSLACLLGKYAGDPQTVVLAMPKGGMAVGAEVAHLLELPFDILLVDRITVPGCADTQLGAITSGGVRMLNCALIDRLQLSDEDVRRAVLTKAVRLARRERLYRSQRPSIDVADRTVILVDDSSTSCATMRDAVRLLRRQHADHVIVAMPVICQHSACELRMEADEVVCLVELSGQAHAADLFDSFLPTNSAEVRGILREKFVEAENQA